MPLPFKIIANADDFGYSASVNKAILFCFKNEYINSATLLTNFPGFAEAVDMIKHNSCIVNIGVHINLGEGKPLTNVSDFFLKHDGCWDLQKTGKASAFFSAGQKQELLTEIKAQINKAIYHGVKVTHFDSHYHLHTLPGLNSLFLVAAKHFNLKLRLAQTYREGSYLKFWYRKYINSRLTSRGLNYTRKFDSVDSFLSKKDTSSAGETIEIMLHPDFDAAGNLTDHYDAQTMVKWLTYLKQPYAK